MNQSWTCSLCRHSSAESFCFCNRDATILCNSCLPTHFSKFPTRYHQNLPLSAYEHHRIPGYFERLQLRTEAVEKAKDSLNQGLKAIDQCIEEFQGKVNQLYKSIWEYGNKVMNEVMRAKIALQEEINKSIEEVEATMYEEQPRLQGKFSARMRNFKETTQFTIFQYDLNVCENVRAIIDFNWISEELSHQHQPPGKATIPESKDLNRKTEVFVPDQYQYQNAIQGGEAEAMVERKWACRDCNFLNFASNPICYKCRRPRVSEYISILPTPTPDKFLLEALETYVPSSAVPWTCSRCLILNSASKITCNCGFVNLKMVSSTEQEVRNSGFSPRCFCSKCGTELEGTRPCSACLKMRGEENIKSGQNKAKVCSTCGKSGCEKHK